MIRSSILILSLITIKSAIGLELNCSYENYKSVYKYSYACVAQNLRTTLNDRKVSEVLGIHNHGKTNADVDKVFVKHQDVPYLPRNLGQFYSNLKVLYVMKSNVQYLMEGDLDGLDKLEIFDVSHNPVDQIGENFFLGHSSIIIVSFYDCHIKKVAPGSLNSLTNIEKMHFEHNVCLDKQFEIDDSFLLEEACEDIYDKCHGNDHTLKINQTETCTELKKSEMAEIRRDSAVDDSSSSWVTILIILLFLTITMNIIFAVTLYRIFKTNFNSSWHEMRNVLV